MGAQAGFLFDRINPEPVREDRYALHRAEVAVEVAQEEARRDSAMWRILARLQQGPATNVELADICLRYTGRMSDLRLHHGYTILREHVDGGVWRYTLTGQRTEVA